MRGQRGDVVGIDEDAGGDLEVAALGGDPHVAHHGAPHEGDPSVVQGGGVEDLLDAVDVAGEGGHDDLPVGVGEDVVQDLADLTLMAHHARDLGVGGVHAEQVHALLTETGEGTQVRDAPVDGQGVILKSPVASTLPASVRIMTAMASGMEWLTATNSRSKGP